MSALWALLPISFRIPRKELPSQSSRKERCSLSRALQLSLKFPVSRLPTFLNGPLQGKTPISRAFFYTFPSKSPAYGPPSMFRNRVPIEREASSPQPTIYSFIHSFISVRVPSKEPSHKKRGKHLVTIHRAPRGWKVYIQWGAAWFPMGLLASTKIPVSQ
jgi:hypothetical protein